MFKSLSIAAILLAVSSTTFAADRAACDLVVANSINAHTEICANTAQRKVSPATQSQTASEFPSAGATVVGSVGFIDDDEVGYFWSASRGDRVTQTYSIDITSITSASLKLYIATNSLTSESVNWDVAINDTVVDSFSVAPGFIGEIDRDLAFPPIAGPSYTVDLRVTNEILAGGGSHTLIYAGKLPHSVDLAGASSSCDLDGDGDFDRQDLKAYFDSCIGNGDDTASCLFATIDFNKQCDGAQAGF